MTEARTQFSDEAIRRFLFGQLNSAEQSIFETSLFSEGELEERVRLAELELSDDFAANRWSGAEKDLFRQRFLITADRETSLEVSKVLQQNFASARFTAQPSLRQQLSSLFDIRQHVWKYAFATVILILFLLATALLIRKEQSRLAGNPGRPQHAVPRPSATSTPLRTNHSTNPSAPTHNETSPTLPLHEGMPASVVLDSGTPLESAPTISVSGDNLTVQLRLGDPIAEFYDVTVINSEGDPVFSANALQRTEDRTLSFDVPASSLNRSDFQVTLTRVEGDAKQIAGTYHFRVR